MVDLTGASFDQFPTTHGVRGSAVNSQVIRDPEEDARSGMIPQPMSVAPPQEINRIFSADDKFPVAQTENLLNLNLPRN